MTKIIQRPILFDWKWIETEMKGILNYNAKHGNITSQMEKRWAVFRAACSNPLAWAALTLKLESRTTGARRFPSWQIASMLNVSENDLKNLLALAKADLLKELNKNVQPLGPTKRHPPIPLPPDSQGN